MKKLLLTILVILLCTTIWAQEQQEPENRKKVAVVLSGGGAKGMAHIGALKVIERAGIPIDIVTGTSMGSIVGGLYAIGYNADILDSLVREMDWNYVISDKEDMWQQSLEDRKKQYTYAISRGFTFGKRNFNDGGIIKGKNLAELFQQLCVGYNDSVNFSTDLPIPFACVATNILDNREVDFHNGRLPVAMRASMAIPAAFSPVRIGDMVLVDGGLRNNYPADIAREMGADIIIGVTVQGAPKTAEDLGGTMSIVEQIIDVNCKNKYDENLAITDVAIRANTTGYNAASFTPAAIDTLIRRGEEEAMKHWDELIALKKRIGIPESYQPKRLQPLRPKVMTERMHVTGFSFENMTKVDERFIREKFHLSKRDSIDAKFLNRLTTSMRVDLFYQTAEYKILPDGNDVRVVLVAGNRKTAEVYAGIRFDTEEFAAAQVGADFPLKGTLPTDFELTARLSKRFMARGELTVHPKSFTAPKLNFTFRRNDLDIYVKGKRNYNIRANEFQAELLPINLDWRHINLQGGIRWDYQHYRDKLAATDAAVVELDDDHYFSYRARINYNSEDNWCFPTRGSRFKVEYAYITDNFAKLNNKEGMSEVNANWRTSLTFGKSFTLQPMVYGRMLFGPTAPIFFANAIGTDWFGHYVEQQMPFAGIGNMEYVDKQFAAAQIQAQYRFGTSHYALMRVATGQQAEKFKNLFETKTLVGLQAAYYFMAPFIGPVGATFGYSNHTKKAYLFLNIGYEF